MLKSSTPLNNMRTPGGDTTCKKRKSEEGDENHSPNVEDSSVKKSRFNLFKSPTIQKVMSATKPLSKQSSSSTAASGIPKRPSGLTGLPRYSRTTRSSVETAVATSSSPTTATSSASKPAKPPKPVVVPSPMQNGSQSPVGNRRLSRAGGRVSIGVGKRIRTGGRASIGGKIKTYFDQSAFNEERFNELLNAKPKGKRWDYKEKEKKQDALITELKTMLKQMIDEHKALKEKCVGAESNISESYKEIDQHRQNLLQDVDTLRTNEARYRKDYFQAAAALSGATTSLQHVQEENSSLKVRIELLEAAEVRASKKLSAEEELRHSLEQDLARAGGELSLTKTWLQESTSNANSQIEHRVEQAVQTYRDQVASLTAQLDSAKTSIEAKTAERGEVDRVAQETRENLLTAQAELRESKQTLTRMAQDADKYQSELNYSRAQCEKKEEQLETQAQMYHALQRSSNDEKSALNSELRELKERLSALEHEKVQATADCSIKENQVNAALKELQQLRASYDHSQSQLAAREQELSETRYAAIELTVANKEKEKLEMKLEAVQEELVCTTAHLKATESEAASRSRQFEDRIRAEQESALRMKEEAMVKLQAVQEECRRNADKATTFESQVKELKIALVDAADNAEAALELGRVSAEAENLRRRIAELSQEKRQHDNNSIERIRELEEQIKAGESARRKMHNTIQELRGNVRVFARVRPYLPGDGIDHMSPPEPTLHVRDNLSLRIVKAASDNSRKEDHSFNFDKAFGPHTNQETIFEEVSEFVQSALDGYNVCLFSYGQTGSGKTHTMQGSGDGPMRGIIPRAMQQVAMYKTELEEKGWEYEMEASFVEIYNETIKDLLREDAVDSKHEIKKDAQGNTYVSDVAMIPVDLNNTEQMNGIMQLAAKHRTVGQTAMNERSSRSHSVFTLHLKATNTAQNICLKGMLNLVDLAGASLLTYILCCQLKNFLLRRFGAS